MIYFYLTNNEFYYYTFFKGEWTFKNIDFSSDNFFHSFFFFIYQYKNSNVINPNINNINSNTVYLNSAHSELSPVLFIIYTQIDKDHPGIKILLCSVVIISLRDPPPPQKKPKH